MLKVTKLGLGQQRYFEASVAKGMDDYYAGKGERPGEWTGRMAAEFGLEGRVSAEQFNALLAGQDPRDPAGLPPLADGGSGRKVAAYDLTFSAPKSVSILATIADMPVRRELHEAHRAAVGAALEYLQDEAVRVRRGKAGATVEKAGGLVSAAYRHRMSRAQDPHLHTHVVTAAIAPGSDGRWTSLDARPLYRMAKAAGTIYQAHLRAEVGERLGLEWREPVEGLAELEAIDQAVIDEFSRRRQDLRKAALEQGLKLDELTIGQRETLALSTRERKTTVDEYPWREGVRARAGEHGLGQSAVDEMLARGAQAAGVPTVGVTIGDTINSLVGPVGLTAMSTAFERPDAVIGVAASSREGMRGRDVLAATDRLVGRADVLPVVGGSALDPRWSTAELMAAEQRLIAAAVGRASEGTAQLRGLAVRRVVEQSDRIPNDGQYKALMGVTTSGNGVDVVEARAGTGKTFMAGLIREAYEQHGMSVIGAAPTGAAARTLADEAHIKSWTIHKLLADVQRFEGFSAGTVLVLDEAGMADTRSVERLLALAERDGVKVVAIGDSGQLASVQAGGWLKAVGDQVGRNELTETRRQKNAAERKALGALHAGAPAVWTQFARQHDRLRLFAEDQAAIDEALEAWTKAIPEYGIDRAVLISRDNQTRALLNAGARQHWDEQGRLGERVDFGPIEVAEGDRIICRRNDSRVDVDNGTRGTIRAVSEGRVVLETDAGTVRDLPASYVAEHVEHAYALTGHGAQGSTLGWAGVVATPEHLTRGWAYTALSRAEHQTMLYVSDEGPERDPNREQEGPALERERDHATTLWRIEQRMLDRDDEDLAIEQLPDLPGPFIGAGREGDHELVGAADPATPLQERGAEPPPAAAVGPAQQQLIELRAMRERLDLQRQALPAEELERLDAIATSFREIEQRRAEHVDRLQALPRPKRFGMDTQLESQRGWLGTLINSHQDRMDALKAQHQALREKVTAAEGRDAQEVARELRGNTERRLQVGEQERELRAQLCTQAVSQPPAWVEKTIGPRPSDEIRGLGDWKRTIRTVTDAQLQIDPSRPLDAGLPDAPAGGADLLTWRGASQSIQTTNRRLGRDLADTGRDAGPELDIGL